MEDRTVAQDLFQESGEEVFRGLRSEPVFLYILECHKTSRAWSLHEMKDRVAPALVSQLSGALFEKGSSGSLEEAQECLKAIRKIHLQNRLKEIQALIARSEKRGEKEELVTLLYKKQDVTKQILDLG